MFTVYHSIDLDLLKDLICHIIDNDKILGETIVNYKKQHSVIMMPMIDSLLKSCSLSISDIDGFVVSSGPGSFTGLRIGMSTIKGLVQATKKPCLLYTSDAADE